MSDSQTIGQRLQAIKQAQFVGRAPELKLFESALTSAERPWQILNLYGPGGIGKSTLLDAFQRIAHRHGGRFIYLDAASLTGSSEIFLTLLNTQLSSDGDPLTQLHELAGQQTVVIAIDTYEEMGALDCWLRDEFISQLPSSCIILIAGRFALAKTWQNQLAWHQLIKPLPLDNFDLDQTQSYLGLNGIESPELVQNLWRYTQGFPLALSLTTLLAQREGRQALSNAQRSGDIVKQLLQRWLRELPDKPLRSLVEAAAIVRNFNQDTLQNITGQPINPQDYERLVECSFVRQGAGGCSMHSLVRHAMAQELSQRAPESYARLRIRALHSLAQSAIQLSNNYDKANALHEFFYLVGDSLVRAALYNEESEQNEERFIEIADQHHREAIDHYMEEWSEQRGVGAYTDIELIDNSTQKSIAEQVTSEPREPELLRPNELVELFPGSVRLVTDCEQNVYGLSVVLPINSDSIDFLKEQPVTRHYVNSLSGAELEALAPALEQTDHWFIRLMDIRDPHDHTTRALLSRNLVGMLIQPARFVTATPHSLYKALLGRFGFAEMAIDPHHDFAKERPATFYSLDLRGDRWGQHLENMITDAIGKDIKLPIDALLKSISQPATEEKKNNAGTGFNELLKNVTAREREVLELAVEGKPNCTIAADLDISEITVKKHMSRIFEKLGIRNRSQLIKLYWSHRS